MNSPSTPPPGTCRVPWCGRRCPITAAFCVDHELHPAPGVLAPAHFEDCMGCPAVAFLRPVAIAVRDVAARGPVVWHRRVVRLCLLCRLRWEDEPAACLASTVDHQPRPAKSPAPLDGLTDALGGWDRWHGFEA